MKIIFDGEKIILNKIEINYKTFIIIIFFSASIFFKTIKINEPLLDWHSWRQCTTAMTARGYYYNGYRFFYPECEYNGHLGYVASELPVYNFIVGLLYFFTGVKESTGRAVSIAFSFFSMLLFYKLLLKYYSIDVGLWASLFFCFLPYMIFYSRTFMPDMMMLFCSIGAIYYYDRYVENNKIMNIIFSGLLLTTAISIKPFCLYLFLPIFYISYLKYRFKIFKRSETWLYSLSVIIIPVFWYGYWHRKLDISLFGSLWDFSGDRWGNLRWWLNINWYIKMIFERLGENWLLGSGLIFFFLGLIKKPEEKKQYMFHFWLLGVVIYFFVIAQGNWVHEYYQLPIMPVACTFAGIFLNDFFKKNIYSIRDFTKFKVILVLFLLFIMIPAGILKYLHHTRIRTEYLSVSSALKRLTRKTDLILVSDYHMPEVIYYSQRRGWHIRSDLQTPEIIETFRKKGVKYYVTTEIDDFYGNKIFSKYMKKYKIIEKVSGKDAYLIIKIS